ncbi:AAA family ATPase [Kroppenstedtia pulmonis]|uniref:AAA family ATPase n=1 Tax=Kroppenstedtia pulmonis TaxID=1380685 RepID=A0A7D3XNK8_9BACL|nr:AAA family ATPase [Kroppenstedtia pulmonis]QKG83047.1 AAA family ATPase [Kroppenstedtia pulmonis]
MLKLKNVSYSYRNSSRRVLNRVSVTFKKTVVNVVLGLNGAGKTTLFDLICGIYKRPAGFEEVPPSNEILYQLQGVPFLTTLKGKDMVKLLLKADGAGAVDLSQVTQWPDMDREEAELMKRLWDTQYGDMSLGERRWLMITSLCEMTRKLYIFDEPTSGVDPESRLKILKRIERLCSDPDKMVIMSSHNLHELSFLNCFLYLIHQGTIVFQGSYADFLAYGDTENPDEAFSNVIRDKTG